MTTTFAHFSRLLLPIICLIIGTGSAWAQSVPSATTAPMIPKPFAGIILSEQAPEALLKNNFYVIPDPGNVDRYAIRRRGDLIL